MHIKTNLKNFLIDQDYYIDMYNNYLHIYSYEAITHLSDNNIIIKLKDFELNINGSNLVVISMDKKELLIKGIITKLEMIR